MIEVLERAQAYPYTSLRYTEINELHISVEDDIIVDKSDAIVIGHRDQNDCNILWGAESVDAFLNAVQELLPKQPDLLERVEGRLYIEFVDPQFVPALENMGFTIVSQFVDYWHENLLSYTPTKEIYIPIREANADDYARVSLITKLCTGQSRGFYGEDADFIKEWNEEANSCILVAEVDGQVAGVCLIKIYGFDSSKGPILWIRQLAVDPKYQNQGIGFDLLEKSIMWGKQNGATRSFLAVDKQNKAISLYTKCGYQCTDDIGQINMALSRGE